MLDSLIQQQISIKMPQRRELPTHAPPIHAIGKQLLHEFADVIAARRQQEAFSFFQKSGELSDVRAVSGNRQLCQTFLDLQIVEKSGKHGRVGLRRHTRGSLVCSLSDVEGS